MDNVPSTVPKQTAPMRGAMSAGHGRLWGSEPLLRTAGQGYDGRLIVEVWEDGRCLSVTGGAALVPVALAALQGSAPSQDAGGVGPQTPMTGPHPGGAAFLGRVIVEVWSDGPLVGVAGSDSRLLDHAIRHLTSLNRSKGG